MLCGAGGVKFIRHVMLCLSWCHVQPIRELLQLADAAPWTWLVLIILHMCGLSRIHLQCCLNVEVTGRRVHIGQPLVGAVLYNAHVWGGTHTVVTRIALGVRMVSSLTAVRWASVV